MRVPCQIIGLGVYFARWVGVWEVGVLFDGVNSCVLYCRSAGVRE